MGGNAVTTSCRLIFPIILARSMVGTNTLLGTQLSGNLDRSTRGR